FLIKHSKPAERDFFYSTSHKMMGDDNPSALAADDMLVLVPAFVTAEITQAFEIGFLLFLPFLVIDFIVASTLMALGMQMMSPTTISLPFKLLLIVMLDGWSRLLHALVLTYQ
ncbi:MAG: EscR/YscR/HrcR family type III secretion system export apparatus protein, partial [Pseudomonadota bacterium]